MDELLLIIPTYKRVNKQLTYNSIPIKYQNKIIFVVRQEEYIEMQIKYPDNTIYCLPAEVNNIATTRQFIFDTFKQKIWMLDDNINKFIKLVKVEDKYKRTELTEQEFDNLIVRIKNYLQTYIHGGVQLTGISPPTGKKVNVNGRIMTNIFADFSKWPKNITYNGCDTCEDFYVNLQLLTKGYANVVIEDINVCKQMRIPGGCNSYRTSTKHNRSLIQLHNLYPQYTRLTKKIKKTGPWKNEEVYSITIYWKKAFKKSITK
jgi:hypothetical protein